MEATSMSKKTLKPLSLTLGTAFAVGLAASNIASAAEQGANPFAMNELSGGYMVAGKEGKCGEGKCGGEKGKEGKCGGEKGKEGKCGGEKGKEGKCGGEKGEKGKEGKCGEGKCGGSK
jgi:uncharacterized low-complexity protein